MELLLLTTIKFSCVANLDIRYNRIILYRRFDGFISGQERVTVTIERLQTWISELYRHFLMWITPLWA